MGELFEPCECLLCEIFKIFFAFGCVIKIEILKKSEGLFSKYLFFSFGCVQIFLGENMKIKNAIGMGLTFAFAISLVACGGDSVNNGDDFISETYNISVDEAASTLSIFAYSDDEGCINVNDEFVWKTNYYVAPFTMTYKYFFVGDSLVLQERVEKNGEIQYPAGIMLVGGHAGRLYGKWRTTDCIYLDGAKECGVKLGIGNTVEYNISPDSVTMSSNVSEIYDNYNSVDLMNSRFMSYALACLYGVFCDIYDSDIFYDKAEDVRWKIKSYKVQVLSQDKNSARIYMRGDTVNFKVNKASYYYGERTVDILVSAHGDTCNHKGLETFSVEPYCSIENEPYFDIREFRDKDDVPVEYVYSYINSNAVEFENCLVGLLWGRELYKKAPELHYRATDAHERFMNAVLGAR